MGIIRGSDPWDLGGEVNPDLRCCFHGPPAELGMVRCGCAKATPQFAGNIG